MRFVQSRHAIFLLISLGLGLPMIFGDTPSNNIATSLKILGGAEFLSMTNNNKFSKAYEDMLEAPKNLESRERYSFLLQSNGFRDTARLIDEGRHRDEANRFRVILEEIDTKNREGRSLPFGCSIAGVFRQADPPMAGTQDHAKRPFRQEAHQLAEAISPSQLLEAEKMIREGSFDCRLLAEWSFIHLNSGPPNGYIEFSGPRTELAFRTLVELGLSNVFPNEILGRPALCSFLAEFLLSAGDVYSARSLAGIASASFSSGESTGWVSREDFEVTLRKIEKQIKTASEE